MQRWIWAVVVVAACKGGKPKHEAPAQADNAALAAPKVAVATVLAKDGAKPPLLVIVDGSGKVRIGAARTWADLDANKVKLVKRSGSLDAVQDFIGQETAFARDPLASIDAWEKISDIDLATLDKYAHMVDQADDPPPPPEEDDRSGGTGTQMALDPTLAHQQAQPHPASGPPLMWRYEKGPPKPNEDGTPARVAMVEGVVMENGKLEPLRAMVVVPPASKATALIQIVREARYAIAVSHDGHIRPLRLQFELRDSADTESTRYWLEARVSAKGIVVEAVPDKPIEVSALDQLGAAIEKARTARGAEPGAPVDVLVDPDIDAQRLVDVLVALDTAGVRTVGLGAAPSAEELARRGHRIPTTALGSPNAQGDLDKALIRRVVKENSSKIAHCYEQALASEPTLAGTVQVQFFITPKGTVGSAAASGVDPTVDKCVENVIKALTFPAPRGGGGVQVSYPFTMRP